MGWIGRVGVAILQITNFIEVLLQQRRPSYGIAEARGVAATAPQDGR